MGKILNTYNDITAAQIVAKASNTCTLTVAGSTVDCTDITVTKIKNVIGGTSTSVGSLCTSGNVNIWSGFSPREFIPSGNTLVSQPKTPYTMGSFAGYNHFAPVPTPPAATFTYNKNDGGGSITTTTVMKCKVGEYDWSKLGATHCKVIVYDGATIYAESTLMPLTTTNNFITFSNVTFTISTTSTYTKDYSSYIMLCNSNGDDLYYIPVTGTTHIEIIAAVTNKVLVTINGNNKVFTNPTTAQYTGHQIYSNLTYSGLLPNPNGKSLSSIKYTIYNSSTDAVVSTNTYTSFNSYEQPQILGEYFTNDPETFYAVSDGTLGRPTPATGQYLIVIMNYV